MKYRREIDGLRAIAVVPVILFHAGISGFSGGYVGVDVFFVLSGYLITTLIVADLDAGRFSLLTFYERRARRILPALLLVVLCCLPFAWAWMLPAQLEAFSLSLIATALFASNVLFWRESGYFAETAEEKPLLHTWSLAVEEQYYLLFPLLLILLWRLNRQGLLVPLLATTALISLGLAEWGARNVPSAAFYLSPTRAWELFAGSLAALAVRRWGLRANDPLAVLGLAAILVSVATFDAATPVPGVWMLLPVGGTVTLILCASGNSRMARLLSLRPLVGVGLVSYSAYLWHQPLFAFARIRLTEPPTTALLLTLACLSFGFAALSWRYVEQPFRGRRPKSMPHRPPLLLTSAAALALVASLGLLGSRNAGFPDRMPPEVLAIAEAGRSVKVDCGSGDRWNVCLLGDAEVAPRVALLGDSHAGRYAWGIDQALKNKGQSIHYAGSGWCVPLLDLTTDDPDKNTAICRREMGAALRHVIADPTIEVIALAAQWSNYTTGFRHGEPVSSYAYADSGNRNPANNPAEFERALEATHAAVEAAGKTLILIDPLPEFTFDVPDRLAALQLHGGDPDRLSLTVAEYARRNADYIDIVERQSMTRIPTLTSFCSATTCQPVSPEGLPLYTDSNHLSAKGLERITTPILARLFAVLEPSS